MTKGARGRDALADVDLPAPRSQPIGQATRVPGGGSLSRGRLECARTIPEAGSAVN